MKSIESQMRNYKGQTIILKKPITVKFYWMDILFYSFFITYGLFGAAAPPLANFLSHPIIGLLQIAMISIFLIIIGITGFKWGEDFKDSIHITYKEFIIAIFLLFALFSLGFENLQHSIQGDESAYLIIAFGHAIKFLINFGMQIEGIGVYESRHLIQIVSGLIVGGLIAFVYFTSMLSWQKRIPVVLFTLILCRVLIMSFGGNPSPHPPLGGIVHLVFGTVFGLNNFALKSAYFFLYCIFIFSIYKLALQGLPRHVSILLSLAVGTVPLGLHLATIVENSIWSLMCFTFVMLSLAVTQSQNYLRLACIVSIATLCRQPAFIGFVPILIVFISSSDRPFNAEWGRNLLKLLVPSIIFIPFLLQSIIYGTPSTEAQGEYSGQLTRIYVALNSGIVLVAIANSIPKLWIACMPSAFIWWRRYPNQSASFLIFFLLAVIIYYSINPGLYGLGKYQAEYALPFAIVGSFFSVKLSLSYIREKLLSFVLLIVIGLNVFNFFDIPTQNKSIDSLIDSFFTDTKSYNSGYHVLCGFPYEFNQAYSEVTKLGLTENSYTIGVSYGVFLEISNGYSLKSTAAADSILRAQRKLNEHNSEGAPTNIIIRNIETDLRIKAIILGAIEKRKDLVDGLIERGWTEHARYSNSQYRSTVILLTRYKS